MSYFTHDKSLNRWGVNCNMSIVDMVSSKSSGSCSTVQPNHGRNSCSTWQSVFSHHIYCTLP